MLFVLHREYDLIRGNLCLRSSFQKIDIRVELSTIRVCVDKFPDNCKRLLSMKLTHHCRKPIVTINYPPRTDFTAALLAF